MVLTRKRVSKTNETEIRQFLDRIVKSDTFSNSEISQDLITYLTEASLKGENPKEFTIGLEVFHLSADDPGSSRVRVFMHKLRKRLDSYYESEGREDAIRFVIPKGAYQVKFQYKKNNQFHLKGRRIIPYLFTTLITIAVCAVIYQIFFTTKESPEDIPFWNELFDNGKETVIVAGDFFLFQDDKLNTIKRRVQNIRDSHINSEMHLREYVAADSQRSMDDYIILSSSITYMPRDALFSMKYLLPLLDRNEVSFDIILSSSFDWERYYDHNIIYIGAFKNLKSLSLLSEKLGIVYDHKMDHINSCFHKQDITYTNFMNDETTLDYTMVAKMPGPVENVILFFVSNNDIGCISSVKFFTQQDSVHCFQKEYMKNARYFKSLFLATGFHKQEVFLELLQYESLNDSTVASFWDLPRHGF